MMRPLTAQEAQAKMIMLHKELSNFQFYLTQNAGILIGDTLKDNVEAIELIQESLEREVARMKRAMNNAVMDTIVRTSLEQAGFKPDGPAKPDDWKPND